MSDRWAIALAGSTWLGAWLARPVPWWVGAVVVAAGMVTRRPVALCVGAALLASGLGARAWAPPGAFEAGAYEGWAVVATDPVPGSVGSVSLDLALPGGRVLAEAFGAPAVALRPRLAGETVWVAGTISPVEDASGWLRSRGVGGRLAVREVGEARPGRGAPGLANSIRRTIDRGASPLPRADRELFTGIVLGDDRDFPPGMADDFRAAGLTHLVAVSGQNVAFVLALTAPVVRRLGFRARWVATVAVLLLFALVTRFEPSVMRATAMAGLAATAYAMGREASTRRLLALAVTGLVLAQPRLVASVGFQLSVAATGGIVVFAGRLAERLPGPRALATATAVTVSAQAAVAPLLVRVFGGVPAVAVPANVAAAPAAGVLMMWGLTGGVVAGLAGGPFAAALHLPTRVLTGWLRGVARVSRQLPLGQLGGVHLVGLAVAGGVGTVRRGRVVAAVLALAVVVQPAVSLARAGPGFTPIGAGGGIWRGHDAVVVELGPRTSSLRALETLRETGVDDIDLIVLSTGGIREAEVLAAVSSRHPVALVWSARRRYVAEAVVPPVGTDVTVGGVRVTVLDADPRPTIDIALDL